MTYAERQQRKKERLFGKDEGAALGADVRTRREMETDSANAKGKGKGASAKASAVRPRVAQSQRGRDLRAEAAVRRAEEQKKAERLAKKEEDGEERDFLGRLAHASGSGSASGSKAKRKKREESDEDDGIVNEDEQLTTTDEEDDKKAVDVGMGERLVKVEEGQEEDWEAELDRMDIGCSTSKHGMTNGSSILGSRPGPSRPSANGNAKFKATVRTVEQDDSATEDSDIEFLEEVRPAVKAAGTAGAGPSQQSKDNGSGNKDRNGGLPGRAVASSVLSSSANVEPHPASRSPSFTLPPPLRPHAAGSAPSPRRHAKLPKRVLDGGEDEEVEDSSAAVQRIIAQARASLQAKRDAPSAESATSILANMLSKAEAESAREQVVCRACTVPNDGQKALCFVCGNVLRPERTPNWRCLEGDCAHNTDYSVSKAEAGCLMLPRLRTADLSLLLSCFAPGDAQNPMDAGVCGCCGARRAG